MKKHYGGTHESAKEMGKLFNKMIDDVFSGKKVIIKNFNK